MEHKINETWDYLLEMGIATEAELELITNINGYKLVSLNDVIYARVGYRNLEQLKECE